MPFRYVRVWCLVLVHNLSNVQIVNLMIIL
jgi:hypothetical protein